jgi:uncharacterized protein (TIRG00374 family)
MEEKDIAIADRVNSVEKENGRSGRILRQVIGYVIAIACLIWVFHGTHPERILGQIGGINWGWIVVGIIFDFLSYLIQGYRWHLLLKPLRHVSVVKTTQAIYSGLFTNAIIPFRTGELVRAYLVSRWTRVRFVHLLPSVMVERFFDAIWLGVGVGLTAFLIDLPKNLMRAADILGVVVLGLIAIFIALVIRTEIRLDKKQPLQPARGMILDTIGGSLNRLAAGIKTIHGSSAFYRALFISPLYWIFQGLALWFIMVGYGLNISILEGLSVMMILLLGIAIPNTPSNVGTFQFFLVLGLTLFNIDKTTASGFSIVAFVVLTLPLLIMGFIAFSSSGMKLKNIRRDISRLLKR